MRGNDDSGPPVMTAPFSGPFSTGAVPARTSGGGTRGFLEHV